MTTPYNSMAVANEFIALGIKDQTEDLSPMKILKLVYLAHGWFLAFYKKPLILERVEAWKFGPVVPSLYQQLKEYGNQPVNELVHTYVAPAEKQPGVFFVSHVCRVPADDMKTHELIAEVWRVYGKYSPIQLSNITHEADSPWSQTVSIYKQEGLPMGLDIPDDVIQSSFEAILSD